MKRISLLGSRKFILYFSLLISAITLAQEPEQDCERYMPVCGLGAAEIVRQAVPMYPTESAHNGIEGWVDLQLRVDSNGNVVEVVVLNSEPPGEFDDEAVTTASKWLFASRGEGDDYLVTPRMFWRFVHEDEESKQ